MASFTGKHSHHLVSTQIPLQNASDKGAAVLNKHTAKGILLPASDHFQAVFLDTSLALHFSAAAKV